MNLEMIQTDPIDLNWILLKEIKFKSKIYQSVLWGIYRDAVVQYIYKDKSISSLIFGIKKCKGAGEEAQKVIIPISACK